MKQQYLDDLKNKKSGLITVSSNTQSLTQAPSSKGMGFGGLFSNFKSQLDKVKAN
jgi:hypothetical protein